MSWKKYEKYRDSGFAWIGEIPENWKLNKLKFIAKARVSNVDKKSIEGQEEVFLCNYIDVYKNEFITNDLEFMKATATSQQIEKFTIEKGDVLITKDSETWDDIAVPAIVKEDLKNVICGYHLAHIKPNKDQDGNYLGRSFASKGLREQFWIEATGVIRFGISKYDIDNSTFLVPPKDEQSQIAQFLDHQTSGIDSLIEKKSRQIELLKEKRSAMITHAVTKGLNPRAKMKDSGVEWIGEIPEGYTINRIKYLGKIKYGLGEPPEYKENGLFFIRATDVYRGKIKADDIKKVDKNDIPWNRNPELKEGDIIVVRSGAYTGDSAIIPLEYEGSIAGYDMVLTIQKAIKKFVAYALLSKYMLEGQIYLAKMRAAQPHLNAEELGCLHLILPTLKDQKNIVEFLDKQTYKIDILISKIQISIDTLKEYRTALISAAVTGKIDVRNWNTEGKLCQ